MRIKSIDPTQIIGVVLFFIAWSQGQVEGYLAWAILLLFLRFKITFRK